MSIIKVTLPGNEIPVNGKQVSFVAPCDCTETEAIQIDGENYTVVDSLCCCVTGVGGVWEKGAVISVVLDIDKKLAYIQNSASDNSRVGDTLTTARTDLGDSWLLCNGETAPTTDYPGLATLLPPSFTTPWKQSLNVAGMSVSSHVYSAHDWVFYAGGKVFVQIYDDASSDATYLYYPIDGDITNGDFYNWNGYRIGRSGNHAQGIAYGNGYWVAAYGKGYYFTEIPESGVVNTTSMSFPNTSQGLKDIEFANGIFAVVCNDSKIYCYENPETLAGQKQISHSSLGTQGLWGIKYGGGYWVATGTGGALRWATDISGPWTANNINTTQCFSYLRYINGYWFTSYLTGVYYTSDPTGTWTELPLASGKNFGGIVHDGTHWIISVENNIYYTEDLTGTWTQSEVNNVCGMVVAGDKLVGLDITNDVVVYTGANTVTLPTISQDKTYTYIKARGGA